MQFELRSGIEVLERTPAMFRTMLGGLSDEWTIPNEGQDTFSAWDNLAHLVHAEHTNWIPRARTILARAPDRRFAVFDRFGHRDASAGRTIAELLEEFARVRAENLVTLRGWDLSARDLSLAGEHPELGEVTLRQLLGTWVVHDLGHIAQTARVLAKQYRDAVGPWQAYLPLLTR